jgi:molybdopterin synthase catalytic subunit/molybdopterin converting factor small subunit
MRVTVRLFAMQRAQTGLRAHDLDLPDGADVAAAWSALVADLPVVAVAEGSVRFARNGRYVAVDEALADGDELAIIPPVAGGADEPTPSQRQAAAAGRQGASGHDGQPPGPDRPIRRLELRETPIDGPLMADLQASVATPADGATVLFVGRTRETPGTPAPGQEAEAERFAGQVVRGLDYEAFEPMALSVLEEIADEIASRFGVRRLAIVHRVGTVGVGEASVVIAAASPHRAEAFEACRYAIEELKARAPIWKAERFTDGSVWLGAPARHGPEGRSDV